MKPTRIATSLSLCLIGIGLAACPDSNATKEPPGVADLRDRAAVESPPRNDRRSAVTGTELPPGVGDRVFFAYDSSVLNGDAQRTLQAQAAWLRGNGPPVLTIQGHADERGTREYNLALGDRRASAVRDYLVSQGVAATRLQTVSYGKERPQAAGHDEASWAQNRRAVSVTQ